MSSRRPNQTRRRDSQGKSVRSKTGHQEQKEGSWTGRTVVRSYRDIVPPEQHSPDARLSTTEGHTVSTTFTLVFAGSEGEQ